MVRVVAAHHPPLGKPNLVVTNNCVVSYCIRSLSVDGGVGGRQIPVPNHKKIYSEGRASLTMMMRLVSPELVVCLSLEPGLLQGVLELRPVFAVKVHTNSSLDLDNCSTQNSLA